MESEANNVVYQHSWAIKCTRWKWWQVQLEYIASVAASDFLVRGKKQNAMHGRNFHLSLALNQGISFYLFFSVKHRCKFFWFSSYRVQAMTQLLIQTQTGFKMQTVRILYTCQVLATSKRGSLKATKPLWYDCSTNVLLKPISFRFFFPTVWKHGYCTSKEWFEFSVTHYYSLIISPHFFFLFGFKWGLQPNPASTGWNIGRKAREHPRQQGLIPFTS